MVGVNYGVLPQISSGFSIGEVQKADELLTKICSSGCWVFASPVLINNEPDIKLVLMSDFQESDALRLSLLNFGWKDWKNFSNNGTKTVIGVIRDDY